MSNIIYILNKYSDGLLFGITTTAEMCVIIWLIGLVLGSSLGVFAAKHPNIIGKPARLGSFMLSGIPILVLLFWLHYPAQSMIDVTIHPFWTSVAAIGLVNVFAVADIIRPVIEQSPKHLITAAKVCGLSRWKSIRHVQLPLILRQATPPLLMTQVTMLQATLFASLISVNEIFRVAQQINSKEYMPVEIYSALAIFFLAICLPLNALAALLKRRFSSADLSER